MFGRSSLKTLQQIILKIEARRLAALNPERTECPANSGIEPKAPSEVPPFS
jgi:hypothetical protein